MTAFNRTHRDTSVQVITRWLRTPPPEAVEELLKRFNLLLGRFDVKSIPLTLGLHAFPSDARRLEPSFAIPLRPVSYQLTARDASTAWHIVNCRLERGERSVEPP